MFTFAIIGGDSRQVRLADLLEKDGHEVFRVALGNDGKSSRESGNFEQLIKSAHAVLLPAPAFTGEESVVTQCSDERISSDDILNSLKPGQIVIGGGLGAEFEAGTANRGCQAFDLLKMEEYAIANAVPTAEGAIQMAMELTPITIADSRCLVVGAGRIGKQLAIRLRLLGAEVVTAARSEKDLAFLRALSLKAGSAHRLETLVEGRDIIFNTVPSRIFTGNVMEKIDPGCLCIDLASLPGGFDQSEAERLNIRLVRGLSLPGKVAPHTCAAGMKSIVERIVMERAKP